MPLPAFQLSFSPMISTDSPNEVYELRDTLNALVQSQIESEKAKARQEQTEIAKKLRAEGSRSVNGIGQKIGSIDRRTFFRLHQENPGCFQNPEYVDQLLRDSPKLRAPGYVPKKHYKPTYVITYK